MAHRFARFLRCGASATPSPSWISRSPPPSLRAHPLATSSISLLSRRFISHLPLFCSHSAGLPNILSPGLLPKGGVVAFSTRAGDAVQAEGKTELEKKFIAELRLLRENNKRFIKYGLFFTCVGAVSGAVFVYDYIKKKLKENDNAVKKGSKILLREKEKKELFKRLDASVLVLEKIHERLEKRTRDGAPKS